MHFYGIIIADYFFSTSVVCRQSKLNHAHVVTQYSCAVANDYYHHYQLIRTLCQLIND